MYGLCKSNSANPYGVLQSLSLDLKGTVHTKMSLLFTQVSLSLFHQKMRYCLKCWG